jgi:hypothetical protein
MRVADAQTGRPDSNHYYIYKWGNGFHTSEIMNYEL